MTTKQDIPLRRTNNGNNEEAVYIPDQTVKIEGNSTSTRKRIIIAIVVLLLIGLIALIVVLVTSKGKQDSKKDDVKINLKPPNVEIRQPPSASALRIFKNVAVCSDSEICSEIGRDIFKNKGNAIDSAIATLFCTGITTMQSMGIGGGFILNFYKHNEQKAYTLDAREAAPINSERNMFNENINASIHGPLSIAVPGEMRGYWTAHRKFGLLPWKDIVEPTIKVCEDGFFMTRHMADAVHFVPQIKADKNLNSFLVNQTSGEFYKQGDLLRPQNICDTLRIIADNGGDDFYNGSIADMLLEDLKDINSTITKKDLEQYKARWSESVTMKINDHTMHLVPFPGSGLFIGFIINILKDFGITEKDILTIESETLLYHRIIEAFKFSFGQRSKYGDPRFIDVKQLEANLKSIDFAKEIRSKINDNSTNNDPTYYGAESFIKNQKGTAHISVLGDNGDAVSVTSTINFYFGSTISGKRTGVIFNNAMNDFSTPGKENIYGLPEAKANYIEPEKRPLSSMSPTIVTDQNNNVSLVIGAAGGSKITTAISTAIMRILWLNQDIKETVDSARFHHQLTPMEVSYEFGVLNQVIDGLEKKGHKTNRYRERGTVICAIYQNQTGIYANADYRKQGDVIGY